MELNLDLEGRVQGHQEKKKEKRGENYLEQREHEA